MNKVTICGVDTSSLPKLSRSESDDLLERIEKGDELYATLTVAGSTMVELKKVEASSIEEIMRKLRKTASRYTGLAKVHIRNRTRGWAIQKAMFASNPLPPQYTCDNTGQYALQF